MANFFIFLPLLICQVTLSEAVSLEPMCSKFSYDEQLLEKMVRMEFYMENVQKDSENSFSNVKDMIHDIKGNNSELSNRLSEQQEKVDRLERQTDILNDTMANKIVVSENTESIKSIAAVVKDIKMDLENNTSDLDNLKVVTDEINKKCEDGLSDLSKNLERQTSVLSVTMANKSIVSENMKNMKSMAIVVANIKKDLEISTSGLDDLKAVTDGVKATCKDSLSTLSKSFESQMEILSNTMANKSMVSTNSRNMNSMAIDMEHIKKDLEKSTSGLVDLKVVTDDLYKKFSALEKQIKELDQETEKKSQVIAFNVMDAVNYTGTDAIKFKRIQLNEGNAYNEDTGVFTAPIDGVYQLNAHICCNKTKSEIEYCIKVGSNLIVTGEFVVPERATDTKCTSFSAVALVRKGDNVRVGGMSFSYLDRLTNDLSSFSGVLIRAV